MSHPVLATAVVGGALTMLFAITQAFKGYSLSLWALRIAIALPMWLAFSALLVIAIRWQDRRDRLRLPRSERSKHEREYERRARQDGW